MRAVCIQLVMPMTNTTRKNPGFWPKSRPERITKQHDDDQKQGQDHPALIGHVRVRLWHGAQQRFSVRVQRLGVKCIARRQFKDSTEIHHRHLVSDLAHHGKIRADEQVGQAKLFLQIFQQVDHLGQPLTAIELGMFTQRLTNDAFNRHPRVEAGLRALKYEANAGAANVAQRGGVALQKIAPVEQHLALTHLGRWAGQQTDQRYHGHRFPRATFANNP